MPALDARKMMLRSITNWRLSPDANWMPYSILVDVASPITVLYEQSMPPLLSSKMPELPPLVGTPASPGLVSMLFLTRQDFSGANTATPLYWTLETLLFRKSTLATYRPYRPLRPQVSITLSAITALKTYRRLMPSWSMLRMELPVMVTLLPYIALVTVPPLV